MLRSLCRMGDGDVARTVDPPGLGLDVARKFADIHGPRLARYLEGAPYLVGADVGGSRGVAPLIQGVVSYIGGARARPYGQGYS